jgi:hypothetical protein
MGLFDSLSGGLKGALGKVEAAAMPALISAALAKTNLGDLQGLVAQLQQGGPKYSGSIVAWERSKSASHARSTSHGAGQRARQAARPTFWD